MCEKAVFKRAMCPHPTKHTHVIERNGYMAVYRPFCETDVAQVAVIQGPGTPTTAQRASIETLTKAALGFNRSMELEYHDGLAPISRETIEDIVRKYGEQLEISL